MQARCIHANGSTLVPFKDGPFFYTADTDFSVSASADYLVHGIGFHRGGLLILVRDDDDRASWLPLDLFEVTEPTISTEWELLPMAPVPGEEDMWTGWQAMLSYPFIVGSKEFHDRLIEGEHAALETFRESCPRRR